MMRKYLSIACISLLLAGCGSSSKTNTGDNPSNGTGDGTKVEVITKKDLGKVQLGVLAGAKVTIEELGEVPYKLLFTEETSDGNTIEEIGNFNTHKSELKDDKYYLFTATGGLDKDANDDGEIDPFPTINKGSLHAIIKGEELKKLSKQLRVSYVSDIQYQKVSKDLNETEKLPQKLKAVTKEILKDSDDLKEIATFNPIKDKAKLTSIYQDKRSEIIQKIYENNNTHEPDIDYPPTVVGSDDSSIKIGEGIKVSVEAFDQDGYISSYAWYENGKLLSERKSFFYKPDTLGKHTLVVVVTDDEGNESEDTIMITVLLKPNSIPVASSKKITLAEDTSVAVKLQGVDSDNDNLSFNIKVAPVHGKLQGKAPNFRYQPNADYFGDDKIVYTVSDGKDESKRATIALHIENVNDAPIITGQTHIISKKQKDIIIQAVDKDNETLTYTITKAPEHGTITLINNKATYTADEEYSGTDNFEVRVSDASGKSSIQKIVLEVEKREQHSEIEIKDIEVGVKENRERKINLAENFQLKSYPKHGEIEIVDSAHVLYRPTRDFKGEDSFEYTVFNASGKLLEAKKVKLYVTKMRFLYSKTDTNNDGIMDDESIWRYNIYGKLTYRAERENGVLRYESNTTYTKLPDGGMRADTYAYSKRNDSNTHSYTIYNADGKVTYEYSADVTFSGGIYSHGTSVDQYKYDNHGNLIEKIYIGTSPTYTYYKIENNKYTYDNDGNFTIKSTRKYGKDKDHIDGMDSEWWRYNKNGQIIEDRNYKYSYDEDGRLIKKGKTNYYYDPSGKQFSYQGFNNEIEVDEFGYVVKFYKFDNKIYEYAYDEYHRLIAEKYTYNKELIYESKYIYINGERKEIYYMSDGANGLIIRKNTYDEFDHHIKFEYEERKGSHIEKKYTTTFTNYKEYENGSYSYESDRDIDSDGTIDEHSIINYINHEDGSYSYEYDTDTDGDGTIDKHTENKRG